jgi:hypothetical protein
MKPYRIYQPAHWVGATPFTQASGDILWSNPDKYPEGDIATEGELVNVLEAMYESDKVSFEAVENIEIMLASVRIVDRIIERMIQSKRDS